MKDIMKTRRKTIEIIISCKWVGKKINKTMPVGEWDMKIIHKSSRKVLKKFVNSFQRSNLDLLHA
jgi:hypothetical protein